MADKLKDLLDSVEVSDNAKADAWDAYNQAQSPDEFKKRFDQINLPIETKAQLWDLKFPTAPAKPPKPVARTIAEQTNEALSAEGTPLTVSSKNSPLGKQPVDMQPSSVGMFGLSSDNPPAQPALQPAPQATPAPTPAPQLDPLVPPAMQQTPAPQVSQVPAAGNTAIPTPVPAPAPADVAVETAKNIALKPLIPAPAFQQPIQHNLTDNFPPPAKKSLANEALAKNPGKPDLALRPTTGDPLLDAARANPANGGAPLIKSQEDVYNETYGPKKAAYTPAKPLTVSNPARPAADMQEVPEPWVMIPGPPKGSPAERAMHDTNALLDDIQQHPGILASDKYLGQLIGGVNTANNALDWLPQQVNKKIDQAREVVDAHVDPKVDPALAAKYPNLYPMMIGASKATNPVDWVAEQTKLIQGMFTDPRNIPFLLEGGSAVRPALSRTGSVLFSLMAAQGAEEAFERRDWGSAAAQTAFALMGMKHVHESVRIELADRARAEYVNAAQNYIHTTRPEMAAKDRASAARQAASMMTDEQVMSGEPTERMNQATEKARPIAEAKRGSIIDMEAPAEEAPAAAAPPEQPAGKVRGALPEADHEMQGKPIIDIGEPEEKAAAAAAGADDTARGNIIDIGEEKPTGTPEEAKPETREKPATNEPAQAGANEAPKTRSVAEIERDLDKALDAGDREQVRKLKKELLRAQNAPAVEEKNAVPEQDTGAVGAHEGGDQGAGQSGSEGVRPSQQGDEPTGEGVTEGGHQEEVKPQQAKIFDNFPSLKENQPALNREGKLVHVTSIKGGKAKIVMDGKARTIRTSELRGLPETPNWEIGDHVQKIGAGNEWLKGIISGFHHNSVYVQTPREGGRGGAKYIVDRRVLQRYEGDTFAGADESFSDIQARERQDEEEDRAEQKRGQEEAERRYKEYEEKRDKALAERFKDHPYAQHIEHVPTHEMRKFAEYDRAAEPRDGEDKYNELKEDIRKNGIREPLILNYNKDTNKATLGEGNHRLAIAHELGIDKVPVRVTRSHNENGVSVPGYKVEEKEPFPGAGYTTKTHVPGDMKPSEIGVGRSQEESVRPQAESKPENAPKTKLRGLGSRFGKTAEGHEIGGYNIPKKQWIIYAADKNHKHVVEARFPIEDTKKAEAFANDMVGKPLSDWPQNESERPQTESKPAAVEAAPDIELDDDLKAALDDLDGFLDLGYSAGGELAMSTGKRPTAKMLSALTKVGYAVYKSGTTDPDAWKKAVEGFLLKHKGQELVDAVSDYLDDTYEDVKEYHDEQSGNQSAAAPTAGDGVSSPEGDGRAVLGEPEAERSGEAESTGQVREAGDSESEKPVEAAADDGEAGRGPVADHGSDLPTDQPELQPEGDGRGVQLDPDAGREFLREIQAEHNAKNFYRHTPAAMENIGRGGEIGKMEANLKALRILKALTDAGRLATPQEKEALSQFVGWGPLADVFRYNSKLYNRFYRQMADALGNDAMEEARKSITDAYYTHPDVVQFMWKLAQQLGFEGGTVLEPSMGSGYFFGMAPESVIAHPDTRFLGVERDDGTAAIARLIWGDHPSAKIIHSDMKDVLLPPNSASLVMGNVPFGKVAPYDPQYKKMPLSKHDYFIIKSLDALKPGGIAMLISSRYSLDKEDSYAREAMAARADLVGVVRLPESAFVKNAATHVTTDVLIFRRRLSAETRGGIPFKEVKPMELRHGDIAVNEAFHGHPERVIGQLDTGGMHDRGGVSVQFDGELAPALDKALKNLPSNIFHADIAPSSAPVETRGTQQHKENSYQLVNGEVRQVKNGQLVELPKDKNKPDVIERIKPLIKLRDHLDEYLRLQNNTFDDAQLDEPRATLNQLYNQFVWKGGMEGGALRFGFINDVANWQAFGDDPHYSRLTALERQDTLYKPQKKADRKKMFLKRDIFTKRTIYPARVVTLNPNDHNTWTGGSLAMRGFIDVDWIAQQLDPENPAAKAKEVAAKLMSENLIYEDPATGKYVYHEDYLSGQVRRKLQEAERAAKADAKYQRNVDALSAEGIQPTPLKVNEFETDLGSMHVPMDAYKEWIGKLLGANTYNMEVHRNHKGVWRVDLKNSKHSFENVDKWAVKYTDSGQVAMRGNELLEDYLNMRATRVTYTTTDDMGDKQTHVDEGATNAARLMQKRMREEFQKWVQSGDHNYRDTIVQNYNDFYNGWRDIERDGSHLGTPITREDGRIGYMLPGMNPNVALNPHQINGVWHGIAAGRAYYNHGVGLGKTYMAGALAMELKRMGLAKKSLYLAPKFLTDPTVAQLQNLYPGAKILAIDASDIQGKERKNFAAMIATGDWDLVVFPYSAFRLTPISPERMSKTIQDELDRARALLEDYHQLAEEGHGSKRDIKDMEKQIAALEKQLEELADSRTDDAVYIDELGIDNVIADEAHFLKNLAIFTKMGRIKNVPGNARNQLTLRFKAFVDHLHETNNNRGVYMMSGTPITNTMGEFFNIIRYVAPDILKDGGIDHFDDFAHQFLRIAVKHSLTADGLKWEAVQRLTDVLNVPELSKMVRSFMHNARVEMYPDTVKVPVANRIPHEIPLTPLQNDLMGVIKDRYDALKGPKDQRPDKRIDNMLFLLTDARQIALDPRLYDHELPDDPDSKVSTAMREVHSIWEKTKDKRGTQLVFTEFYQKREKEHVIVLKDDGTPKLDSEGNPKTRVKYGKQLFDLHEDMRKKLLDMGIPADEVALLNDFGGDSDSARDRKMQLYQDVRDGKVRVLIATRAKGGVGVNVQDRVVAMHHLDVPYTPERLDQSEGRGIRQGNENESVDIHRWVATKIPDVVKETTPVDRANPKAAPLPGGTKIPRVLDDKKMYRYPETHREVLQKNPAPVEAFLYDTVVNKRNMMNKVYDGTIKDRSVSDLAAGIEMDENVAAAIAAGDPDAVRKAEVTYELTGLQSMEDNYQADRLRAQSQIQWRTRELTDLKAQLQRREAFLAKWDDREMDFHAVIDGLDTDALKKFYLDKHKGESEVSGRKAAVFYLNEKYPQGQPFHTGQFNFYGEDVPLRWSGDAHDKKGGWQYQFAGDWFDAPLSGVGILAGFEQRAAATGSQIDHLKTTIGQKEAALQDQREKSKSKSPYAEQINKLRTELNEINERMGVDDEQPLIEDDDTEEEDFSDNNFDDSEEGGELGYTKGSPPLRKGNASFTGKRVTREQLIKKLRQLADDAQLNYGHKKILKNAALGVYMPHGENIRLKYANDVAVMAHETFHALNKIMFGKKNYAQGRWHLNVDPFRPYRNELIGVATPSQAGIPGGRLMEGFAEYGRLLITDPQQAQVRLPRFHQFFMNELAKPQNARYRKLITELQQQTENYVNQSPRDYVLSHIDFDSSGNMVRDWSVEGVKKMMSGFLDKMYTRMFDDQYPIRKLEKEAFAKLSDEEIAEFDDVNSPYIMRRLTRKTAGMLESWLQYGARKWDSEEPVHPSVLKIITQWDGKKFSDKDRETLLGYWVAKSALTDYKTKGLQHAFENEEKTQQFLDDVEQNQPEIASAAKALTEQVAWPALDFGRDGGLFEGNQVRQLKLDNPNYAASLRIPAEELHKFQSETSPSASAPNALRKRKGGTQSYLNPLEGLALTVGRIIHATIQNRALMNTARLARKVEGLANMVQFDIDPSRVPVEFRLAEIKKTLEQAGFVGPAQALDTLARVWRTTKPKENHGYVSYYHNGKYKVMWVAPELQQALTPLNYGQRNIFTQALAGVAGMIRFTTTGISLAFPIRHLQRQVFLTLAQTRNNVGVVQVFKGVGKALIHNDEYIRAKAAGALQSAAVSLNRSAMRRMTVRMLSGHMKYSYAHPLEALRDMAHQAVLFPMAMSESSDESSRIPEFVNARKAGKGWARAAFDASEAGIDNTKMGSWIRPLVAIDAFLGPIYNHADSFFRAIKDNPRRSLLTLAAIALIGAAIWSMNQDPDAKEAYDELPDWAKFRYWAIPLPKHAREKMGASHIFIEKPFQWGYVGSGLTEAMLDRMHSDKEALPNWMKDQVDEVLPKLPDAFVLMYELTANKNLLTKNPIVFPHEAARSPHLQKYQNTSQFAKEFAKQAYDFGKALGIENWTDISPIKIDYAMRRLGGNVYTDTNKTVELAERGGARGLADLPVVSHFVAQWPNPQSKSITKFYDVTKRLEQKVTDKEQLSREEERQLNRIKEFAPQIKELQDSIRALDANTKMDAEKRDQQIRAKQLRILKLAQQAIVH